LITNGVVISCNTLLIPVFKLMDPVKSRHPGENRGPVFCNNLKFPVLNFRLCTTVSKLINFNPACQGRVLLRWSEGEGFSAVAYRNDKLKQLMDEVGRSSGFGGWKPEFK
jgi:hypothetical protein